MKAVPAFWSTSSRKELVKTKNSNAKHSTFGSSAGDKGRITLLKFLFTLAYLRFAYVVAPDLSSMEKQEVSKTNKKNKEEAEKKAREVGRFRM